MQTFSFLLKNIYKLYRCEGKRKVALKRLCYNSKRKETHRMNAVIYIHGKSGNSKEANHYQSLFKEYDVIGLDYKGNTPWDVKKEIEEVFKTLNKKYKHIILIANSIGAYYALNSNIEADHAFFISPIVDMEKMIIDMMKWANVTEDQLEKEKIIHTEFNEDLSWDYLTYVRSHSIRWTIPTDILYGENDQMIAIETINKFTKKHVATITIMKEGEHWFHTKKQMAYLDQWINKCIKNEYTIRK